MSTDHRYEHDDQEYGRNSFKHEHHTEGGATERTRPTLGRRRAKSPQSVNGIHKRRRRKMSW
ncbi:hypothetical protein Pla108_35060 [Botrimarina colliarenosi]|uniref:Uncharacterized protein n=1 Tax=Botrimarina colliarenosi TaxID=2528001 RepID=A0A5C6A774_9BACT|nr:hypothetical protein [Botrimarina colliarenosi]TWT95359.1 hypothetical protein Pla108_35060 [Botrimarina colliarenosi]